MSAKYQTMQELLTLAHINNELIENDQAYPYYIPKEVEQIFKNKNNEIIIVEFNKLLLFGKIKISDQEHVLIGPMTKTNLFYDKPLNAFAYLKTSKNYVQLKSVIDKQANFSLIDFSKLLQKIFFILFNKTIESSVFKRTDTATHKGAYQDKVDDDVMFQKLIAAIRHGDIDQFQKILTYPQVYLNSFINLEKTSPEHMRKEFYRSMITATNIALESGITQEALNPIQNKYSKLWEHAKTDPVKAGHVMISTIYEIMDLIKQKRFFSTKDPIVNRVTTYVDNNFKNPISRNEIADALNLSPSYLSGYFKEKTGITISRFIQLYKINKAEMFLESNDLSIIEISDYLGFTNVTYFNRIFKKITGQTPTEYRKNH